MRRFTAVCMGVLGIAAGWLSCPWAQALESPFSQAMDGTVSAPTPAAAGDRSGQPVPIDLTGVPLLGDPSAKVAMVTYVCARCPFCSKLVPQLAHEVTDGQLKGKARLYVKLFPIRSHANSSEAAQAVLAAGDMGKFWPYLLKVYEDFDSFSPSRLGDYAQAVGLDRVELLRRAAEPALRARLVDSKKEGLRNGVEATPTVFLSGYRYSGELTTAAIVQAALLEASR